MIINCSHTIIWFQVIILLDNNQLFAYDDMVSGNYLLDNNQLFAYGYMNPRNRLSDINYMFAYGYMVSSSE